MLFCSLLSKINIMNEWSAEGEQNKNLDLSDFESEYRYDAEKSADEMGSSDYIRTQTIVYDQSLCQRSKLLILNWIRNELKELNCERLHPRCSRLTCIEETKIKENDKILQQCVVWRSIVVTLFCFLWMKCREGEQLWRLIIEFTCYKVKSSIIAIL